MTAVFLIFLAFFTIGTFKTEDRKFSEMENRNLEQKPELTAENVFSGDYADDAESYLADQLFKKDAMMSIKTCCDYFTGKTYQNGVYFSEDGYLLQKYEEDSENISKNVSYINAFADSVDVPVDFILVPNAICLNSDKLPIGAVTDDQNDTIASVSSQLSSKITLFNPYQTLADLQNQNIQAYYRTDHHWTASAARAVCDAWLNSAGYSGTDANYVYRETPDFYGTLYSKAPAGFTQPDTFGYYENVGAKYTVNFVNENTFTYSMFDVEYLSKKDKYSTFFGGNYAEIQISSESENKEKILVLKDSYANSVIPFLADKFSEVYVVDLRYFHFDKVSELIEENDIDRVLMLYNVDFLNEDTNFIWLE
jgi:hypothetical protein